MKTPKGKRLTPRPLAIVHQPDAQLYESFVIAIKEQIRTANYLAEEI